MEPKFKVGSWVALVGPDGRPGRLVGFIADILVVTCYVGSQINYQVRFWKSMPTFRQDVPEEWTPAAGLTEVREDEIVEYVHAPPTK